MTSPVELPTEGAMPKWGDIVLYPENGLDDLPDAPVPYYVLSDSGLQMHRRLVFGRGLVKAPRTPQKLNKNQNPAGIFMWDGKPVPKEIMAQVVDFFTRTYDKHHTEAAVNITQNQETGEYRVYIPIQRLSHGGVFSLMDPSTVQYPWVLVGTFHSHCDFAGNHSTTDEADAREMDGFHGTIGNLKHAAGPHTEIMVSMNKQLFRYKDISIIADMSDLTCAKAPEWWDRYLWFGKVTEDMRPDWLEKDEHWERFMGRTRQYYPTHSPTTTPVPHKPTNIIPTNNASQQAFRFKHRMSTWFENVSNTVLDALGFKWDDELGMFAPPLPIENNVDEQTMRAVLEIDRDVPWSDVGGSDYWEEALGKRFVDMLFDQNVMTEQDLDRAILDGEDSGTITYWQEKYLEKLLDVVIGLDKMGINVEYGVQSKIAPFKGNAKEIH